MRSTRRCVASLLPYDNLVRKRNERCRRSAQNRTCRFPTKVQLVFAESHAAAVKHAVITIEKMIGRINRYLQLTTVIAAKQSANAHAVPRMSAKVAVGRPPSCHANIAANSKNTLIENPAARKRSQYVRS